MLKIDNITKKYDDKIAIKNISFTVEKGSIYGLFGYNGAGKTTLLKTISGIFRPDEGNVLLDNQPVFDNETSKSGLFLVTDTPYWFPQANMKNMSKIYAQYYPKFSEDLFEKLVAMFSLDVTKRLSGFSKGMQKQASLIFALCVGTDYVLLDETFDGLDYVKRDLVLKLFNAAVEENGLGIIISSHNLSDTKEFCNNMGVIDNNSMIYNGCASSISLDIIFPNGVMKNNKDYGKLFK